MNKGNKTTILDLLIFISKNKLAFNFGKIYKVKAHKVEQKEFENKDLDFGICTDVLFYNKMRNKFETRKAVFTKHNVYATSVVNEKDLTLLEMDKRTKKHYQKLFEQYDLNIDNKENKDYRAEETEITL